nr:hypothetical protein EUGRSUZ_I00934 [Ipomoea batatas]
MVMNSSMSITPSRLASTALTISLQSCRLHFSPSLCSSAYTSPALIFPSPSLSNVLNAVCRSIIFMPPPFFCTSTNSLKSINPSPSESATSNIFWTSLVSSMVFPMDLNMALYSSGEIFPSLLESNLSKTFFRSYILDYELVATKSKISPPAGHAEGSNLHRGCHYQWSFRRVAYCKFVMHEPTLDNGLVLQHYLVTIATLEPLLILIAAMCTVLHLLEIPYHAKFANCCNQVAFLFSTFSNLKHRCMGHMSGPDVHPQEPASVILELEFYYPSEQ